MGSKGRPIFDLNEPPAEEDEENDGVLYSHKLQRAVPSSNTHTSDLFATSTGPPVIVNNHAFSHASSVSGFRPFVRPKGSEGSEFGAEQKRAGDMSFNSKPVFSNGRDINAGPPLDLASARANVDDKEEGEWSDAEGSTDACKSSSMPEQLISGNERDSQEKGVAETMDHGEGIKDENTNHDPDASDMKSNSSRNSEVTFKGDTSVDGREDIELAQKPRETKGAEPSHVMKTANNLGKRPKLDQHKEAMLGKKRSRQTMFLNLEDVKQAGPIKTSTPRRPPAATRTNVRETNPIIAPTERTGEKQVQAASKDVKQVDLSINEGNSYVESNDPKSEYNGEMNSGLLARPRRLNIASDLAAEAQPPSVPKQSSWKQLSNTQVSSRKPAVSQNFMEPKVGLKKVPSKKQAAVSTQYQDTSVERLLREVTNENFWHHPGIKLLFCYMSTYL